MEKFVSTYYALKLTQIMVNHLNIPVIRNKIETDNMTP